MHTNSSSQVISKSAEGGKSPSLLDFTFGSYTTKSRRQHGEMKICVVVNTQPERLSPSGKC